MGVLGLWQLLSPVGQPVTLESLENKIFAVDISIWLNQAVKGYRDSTGGSVPNAHLLSLFSRLCKLLFYKIRPIIVFDGGFPELKKQTIINRQQRRAAIKQNTREFGLKILTNYLASQQLGKSVPEASSSKKVTFKTKAKPNEEIFKLPPLPENSQSVLSDSHEGNDDHERKFTNFSKEDIKYLNQIDIESEDFNALPADVKQEILSTLKESRRHRTWDQHCEMPEESYAFSSYQMQCLLKKRKLQSKLEEVQKDLRQINSSAYVSQYANDHVIGETNKIMSDDTSYYVLLKKITDHNEKDSGKKLNDDVNPSTSAMADTKSAFIRDIENIDFDEDCFDEDVKLEQNAEEIRRETVKIKTGVDSLDFSDEEYSVDNPPANYQSEVKLVNDSHRNTELYVQKVTTTLTQESVKSKEISIDLSDEESGNEYEEKNNLRSKGNENDQDKQIVDEYRSTLKDIIIESQTLSSKPSVCDEIKSKPCTITDTSASFKNTDEEKDNETLTTDSPKKLSGNFDDKPQSNIKNSIDVHLPTTIHNTNRSLSFSNNARENNHITLKTDSSEKINADRKIDSRSISNEIDEQDLPTSPASHSFEDVLNDTSSSSFDDHQPADTLALDESQRKANLELQKDLDTATEILEAEQAKQDRQASTVQDHMIEECKELLQLFGIPYVVSPLEAEAQCAFYDIVDFTHGTITDDSDVWLFGGKRVYKNFFTQQKFVECFKSKEIFSHFTLSRQKLINFALLTGSDYTEGIEGVGPVTAMEIISEFPGESIDALQKFKDWWKDAHKHTRIPENKVRAKLIKLVLPENFPDEKVFDAYLNPEVDDSMEKFTWGRPDLDAIRDYTKERFGWNQSKVDNELLPVLKKLNERDKQMHLDSYFTMTLKKDTNLFPSKRIMAALKKMASPEKQEPEKKVEPSAAKRKSRNSGNKRNPKKVVKISTSTTSKNKKRTVVSQGPMLSEESSSDSS